MFAFFSSVLKYSKKFLCYSSLVPGVIKFLVELSRRLNWGVQLRCYYQHSFVLQVSVGEWKNNTALDNSILEFQQYWSMEFWQTVDLN